MNIMFVVVVILIIAAVFLAVLKKKQPAKAKGLTFENIETLFSPAERSFLGVLERSIDDRYRVFGKVRLGDIVKPAKGLSNSLRATAQNKIYLKHVDFVLCSVSNLAVIGVIELDDKSHERADRAGRDEFVDQALASAKVPVIHFAAKKSYAIQEVREKLVEMFRFVVESPVPTVEKEVSTPIQLVPRATVEQVSIQPEEAAPVCPKCSSVMLKRQAQKGTHAGKYFWACSSFPNCRQVVAIG